jgi:hypothetical protein
VRAALLAAPGRFQRSYYYHGLIEVLIAVRPNLARYLAHRGNMVFPLNPPQQGCERAGRSPQRRKEMKKSVLTIALAVATTFVLSQPAALAKSPKGGAAKTTAAKKHHKKHMKKTASAVAPAVKAA